MTGPGYEEIAAACDQLLRCERTSLVRLAVPLLHVINEHPAWLAQYASLLPSACPASTTEALARPAAVPAASRLPQAGRALYRAFSEGRARLPGSVGTAERVEVLIVSRLMRATQSAVDLDHFFGPLQALLGERGHQTVTALIDHTQGARGAGTARCAVQDAHRVLPRRIAPLAEIRLWRNSLRGSRRLEQDARAARDPLARALALRAARQLRAGVALQNLRVHHAVTALCRTLQPRVVITTYEGDASERIIWHAARSADPAMLCVGYQHTVMLQRAHALRRAVRAPGLACDPDVLLTLGEFTHAALAASSGLAGVPLLLYGSHRRAAADPAPPSAGRPGRCLVLPDANPEESRILFEFALACARQLPALTFVLRPHPLTDPATLGVAALAGGLPPANVELGSATTLAHECTRARYCLYRGSSAVMHAVLAGVRPFYLARPGELAFDPLYALKTWRAAISSPADLAAEIQAAEDERDLASWEVAREFCTRYVAPLRPAALEEMFRLVAVQRGSRAGLM